MSKATNQDPQDYAEEGKGYTSYQKKRLTQVIRRIGKTERPDYRGGRGYVLLPGEG